MPASLPALVNDWFALLSGCQRIPLETAVGYYTSLLAYCTVLYHRCPWNIVLLLFQFQLGKVSLIANEPLNEPAFFFQRTV